MNNKSSISQMLVDCHHNLELIFNKVGNCLTVIHLDFSVFGFIIMAQ